MMIDADFPGGNIQVLRIDNDTAWVRPDLRDTAPHWFHWCFRVKGAAGRTIHVRFDECPPPDGPAVIGALGPALSLDQGESWQWLRNAGPGDSAFSYKVPKKQEEIRLAVSIPYTQKNLDAFLARQRDNPSLVKEALCVTEKNRTAEKLLIRNPARKARHRIALSCRHHACENMASFVLEGIMEGALSKSPEATRLLDSTELIIFPFVDKDGVEAGDQGKNRQPHDHNRDYGTDSGAGRYATVRAIKAELGRTGAPSLLVALDLHCPGLYNTRIPGRTVFPNECIFLVGSADPILAKSETAFSELLESKITGSLSYRVSDNIPYGKLWNIPRKNLLVKSFANWASTLSGVRLSSSLEIPYANANGAEMNPESARAFGRDLLRTLSLYLKGETHE